jgi:hypothetical protein
MMRGASGDECGKLLGQEYNRPAEAGVLKKPREATLTLHVRHPNYLFVSGFPMKIFYDFHIFFLYYLSLTFNLFL